jgi:RNA recognition motif-containing protein
MSNQPNTTLYINNLNDHVNKEELRSQLYALFSTYGKIIDVVASKRPGMRGQAFLVFTDLAGATSALRGCEGMVFYDKPMHIDYAKSKSYATLKRDDPNFVPPNSANASQRLLQNERITISSDKRQRDDEDEDDDEEERQSKREKGDDDDGEEMEIDEDEESAQPATSNLSSASVPPPSQQPSSRLLCTNLPQEVTDDVLSVLFQQYKGFRSNHVVQSPTPNEAGAKVKMAQVLFDTPDLATVAKDAMNGFLLKKGWKMSVAYI